MKKYFLSLAISLIFNRGGVAQTVYLNGIEWPGYIYTCNNSPISLNVTVSGSNAPDSCIWLSENFDTLSFSFTYSAVPGTYTMGLIDNGIMYNYDLLVFENQPIDLSITLSEYGTGINVSAYGGNDGYILLDVDGGQLPYTYSWSNNATTKNDSNLTAGTYYVTVTDAIGCTNATSATLTQPPQPLTISGITADTCGGGYHISVCGKKDGRFKVNIAGGSPPYKLNVNGLSLGDDTLKFLDARLYSVEVTDNNGAVETTSITLTEPTKLQVSLTPQTYTVNGSIYNLTCYDCGNGSITSTVTGGVSPYTYSWNTGQTTANISGLSGGYYILSVTDRNGAQAKEQIFLKAPEKADWSLSGNAGTDSLSNFIGTTDTIPLIFKTNNVERIHIEKDGIIELKGDVVADKIKAKNLNIDTLKINRIMSQDGDTLVRLGLGSINFTPNNNFYGTAVSGSTIDGLGIGRGSYSFAYDGLAIGTYNRVSANGGIALGSFVKSSANGAIAIGYGNPSGVLFDNDIPLSISFATRSTVPTLFISESPTTTTTGNVGINTTSPTEKLQIANGSVYIQGEGQGLILDEGSNKRVGFIKYPGRVAGIWRTTGADFGIGRVNVNALPGAPTIFSTDLYINGTGKVGIGNTNPAYQLSVTGTISSTTDGTPYNYGFICHAGNDLTKAIDVIRNGDSNFRVYGNGNVCARSVLVTLQTPFPDYVFENDYKLLSLDSLDRFIKNNKHLPDFPSAEIIKKSEFVDIGDIQIKTIEKLEELYLYVIELKKENDELKRLINNK